MQRLSFIILTLLTMPFKLVMASESGYPILKMQDDAITIDGKLDDIAWQSLEFGELKHSLIDQKPAPYQTFYKLAYDKDAIYLAIRAVDQEIQYLRRRYTVRDVFAEVDDDKLWITIDPTGENKTVQYFGVTAACVQFDGIYDNHTSFQDAAPQYQYESQCRVDQDAWTVEMRIPFSQLMYRQSPTSMRFLVQRSLLRTESMLLASSLHDYNAACITCSEALVNVESPEKRQPYRLVSEAFLGRSEINRSRKDRRDLGATLSLPLALGTGLDLTVNPDYSQVDADEPYLSANAAFPQSQTEKRPFFLEGGDLLYTNIIQSADSRSIISPQYGAKLIRRGASYGTILLVARDRPGNFRLLPGTYGADYKKIDQASNNLISRTNMSLSDQVSVGFTANFKDEPGSYRNLVLGSELAYRPDPRQRFLVIGLQSRNHEKIAEDTEQESQTSNYQDKSYALAYDYNNDRTTLQLSTLYLGSRFINDLSFAPENGLRVNQGTVRHATNLEIPAIALQELYLSATAVHNSDLKTERLTSDFLDFTVSYVTDKWLSIEYSKLPRRNTRVSPEGPLHQGNSDIISLSLKPPLYLNELACSQRKGRIAVTSEDALGNNTRRSCRIQANLGMHVSVEYRQERDYYEIFDSPRTIEENLQNATLRLFIDQDNFFRFTYLRQNTETAEGRSKATRSSLLFAHQPTRGMAFFLGTSRGYAKEEEESDQREYFFKLAYTM